MVYEHWNLRSKVCDQRALTHPVVGQALYMPESSNPTMLMSSKEFFLLLRVDMVIGLATVRSVRSMPELALREKRKRK